MLVKLEIPSEDFQIDFKEEIQTESAVIETHCPNDVSEDERSRPKDLEDEKKPQKKVFKCDDCSKVFALRILLKRHIDAKHRKVPFHCRLCKREFRYKRSLNRHMKNTQLPENEAVKCEHCSKTFTYNCLLRQHIGATHLKIRFPCHHCSKEFQHKKALEVHMKLQHMLQNEALKCSHCSKVYDSSSHLKQHIDDTHLNIQHRCSLCSAEFMHNRSLVRHLKDKHGVFLEVKQKKAFECDNCSKAFDCPIELERHVEAVHLKPRFTSRANLERHMNNPRMQGDLRIGCPIATKIPVFKCENCSLGFADKSSLDRHKLYRHCKDS